MRAKSRNGGHAESIPSAAINRAQDDPVLIHSLRHVAPFGKLLLIVTVVTAAAAAATDATVAAVSTRVTQRPLSFDDEHCGFLRVVHSLPTQYDCLALLALGYRQIIRHTRH